MEQLLRRNEGPFELEFSAYTAGERRRIFRRVVAEANEELLMNLLGVLEPDEELALHSTVWLANGQKRHLPMIDLVGRPDVHLLERLVNVMPPGWELDLSLYDSGRSYHGYVVRLVDDADWVAFMGRLLLANHLEEPAVTDWRWIGHRLLKGYSALRWSCNTSYYRHAPVLLGLTAPPRTSLDDPEYPE
ncbi:MAG: hypothetical protein Q8P18_23170 [Pseudomonadota bacterium]|nr:hypothetical protein [Pseudomonadota bacterium]